MKDYKFVFEKDCDLLEKGLEYFEWERNGFYFCKDYWFLCYYKGSLDYRKYQDEIDDYGPGGLYTGYIYKLYSPEFNRNLDRDYIGNLEYYAYIYKGLQIGDVVTYYPNGQLKSIISYPIVSMMYYPSSVRGRYFEWHSNGVLAFEGYRCSDENQLYRIYDENGNLKKQKLKLAEDELRFNKGFNEKSLKEKAEKVKSRVDNYIKEYDKKIKSGEGGVLQMLNTGIYIPIKV